MLRPASLLPSLATAFDAPLGPSAFLPQPGACYRALRRLPGQDLHLLEDRVFQDAPCFDSTSDLRSSGRWQLGSNPVGREVPIATVALASPKFVSSGQYVPRSRRGE